MINLEELKPVLEEVLKDREDAASVIEQIAGLDKDIQLESNKAEIDALNKSWNERFMKAFFGQKGEDMSAEVPSVPEAEPEEDKDGENLTYEGLFEEVKEKKED